MYGTTQGSFKPSAEHCVLAHPIWPLCEKLKVVLLAKKSILRATVCCGAMPSLCPPCTDGHGTTSKLGLQPQSLSELLYGGTVPAQAAGRVRAGEPMLQADQHLQIKEQLRTNTQEL